MDRLKQLTGGAKAADKFKLVEKIGKGNYGSVHKAVNLTTREVCAVKIVPIEAEEDYRQIATEVEILSTCAHENITKFYGAYMMDNSLWVSHRPCPLAGSFFQVWLLNFFFSPFLSFPFFST